MGWSGLTLVTDADLGSLEPQATNGKWQSVSWPNQRAEAKKDIKIWLQNDYADKLPGGVIVADRVRDTFAADKVWGYTGGTFSDESVEAETPDENDIDVSAILATFGTDRIYIGSNSSFDGLDVTMLDALNAIASTLTVKYWGAGGWTSLTVTDGTSASSKTFAQSGRVTWTQPGAWQRRTLNGESESLYWVELSISAALTAGTSISQLTIIQAPDGLKRVAALQALGYIVQNLATQAPSTDYWNVKATNQWKTGYMDRAKLLYAEMRDKGGIPIDLDDDGTIEPGETSVSYPVRMGRA